MMAAQPALNYGLFCDELVFKGPFDAIVVPDTAIGTDLSRRFVWVLGEGDVAEMRVVELGRRLSIRAPQLWRGHPA